MKVLDKTMVEYILEHPATMDYEWFCGKVLDYAFFLSQEIKLEMFIPCKNGKPLSDPELTMMQGDGSVYYSASDEDFNDYQEAESKVLFKDTTVINRGSYFVVEYCEYPIWVTWNKTKTIEDLLPLKLKLIKEM